MGMYTRIVSLSLSLSLAICLLGGAHLGNYGMESHARRARMFPIPNEREPRLIQDWRAAVREETTAAVKSAAGQRAAAGGGGGTGSVTGGGAGGSIHGTPFSGNAGNKPVSGGGDVGGGSVGGPRDKVGAHVRILRLLFWHCFLDFSTWAGATLIAVASIR